MTATNELSVAILKRRYAGGRLPKAQFTQFPFINEVQKKEDFVGDDYQLPLQTENPQGAGTTISAAQGSAEQGHYVRFLLDRIEYFGVARIKGQALRTATTRGDGAVVDLWTNEMDGITATVLKMLEVFAFGTGNGVLGTVASGVGTATVTLSVAEDVNNFDLGMRVKAVSSTTLSPAVRSGEAKIIGIDRATGTLTISGNWTASLTGMVDGDSLVRAGDQAIAGVNKVPAGMRQWLLGGSSPGTWKSLDRNADPVRTASQTFDMTGLPMENAVIDLESLITTQGHMDKRVLWTSPRDLRQIKKSQYGKVMLSSGGGSPTIGFDGAKFVGDGGIIDVKTSPFCPRHNTFLKDMTTFALYSAGPAPQPLDFDKVEFLRVATDDAYEVRIGLYGDFGERAPVKSARGTNFGV
jgi:hypothetical protein